MITIRSSTIFMKFTIQGFLGAKTRSNYDSFSENLPKNFRAKMIYALNTKKSLIYKTP